MIRYNCTSCQWTGSLGDTFDGMCPMCCKAGSDAESIARAQELLGHADQRTTRTFYRLAPERVKPAK